MSEERERFKRTYFYDTKGIPLGDGDMLLPSLHKGMKITITKHDYEFEVIDWSYHYGYDDEESGLRITLKETTTKANY